ncbi:MAG TPA: hypothetical protein VFQ45_17145 [Longimicrobium sp.]|nr:hypothetical protein [Longimicrobium sp.]
MRRREWRPIPQEAAQRVPPRRRPPTAVGTMRPPPPEEDGTPIVYESRTLQRVARGVLSPVFVGVGVLLVGGPLFLTALGIGSVGVGAALAWQALRGAKR